MNIEESLSFALTANTSDLPLAKHEAIFKIGMWMRYPSSNDNSIFKSAFYCCCAKYLIIKHGDKQIDSTIDFSILSRNMKIGDIEKIFSGEFFDIPNFDEFNYYKSEFDEYSYAADIIKFILNYDLERYCLRTNTRFDKRKVASLNSAFQFVMRYGFKNRLNKNRTFTRSWSNFSSFWQKFGAAFAFHYVNDEHYGRQYFINPMHGDFYNQVNEIAEDFDAFVEFLGKVKTVSESLQRKLHPRAFKKVSLPNFPTGLTAIPIEKFEFSDEVYAAMSRLRLADKGALDE